MAGGQPERLIAVVELVVDRPQHQKPLCPLCTTRAVPIRARIRRAPTEPRLRLQPLPALRAIPRPIRSGRTMLPGLRHALSLHSHDNTSCRALQARVDRVVDIVERGTPGPRVGSSSIRPARMCSISPGSACAGSSELYTEPVSVFSRFTNSNGSRSSRAPIAGIPTRQASPAGRVCGEPAPASRASGQPPRSGPSNPSSVS